MQKYELDIISNHPDFAGKTLKQYSLDGIQTVGAYGSEAFQIRFKNNTWSKVELKLSIDGTDTCTGEPATTEPTGDMWVVAPYSTLTLKAWKESDDGGAAFVFTNTNNSVAVHTHGDLSCKGIIAAAVFEESATTPITVERHHYYYHDYPWYVNPWVYPYVPSVRPYWDTIYGTTFTSYNGTLGGTYTSNNATVSVVPTSCAASGGGTIGACCFNSAGANSLGDSGVRSLDLGAGPACGAGQFVEQKVAHTTGLIKPVFTETVKVRYIWWDSLQEKLREQQNAPSKQPSGFPGDRPKGIDLGSTPRIGSASGAPRKVEQVFSRV